ncbi:hypothetical protein QO259_05515 [Salinicola sp. JS01]|uniref:hypothetical protein n=1 Tax=Salinicola sp. JS01 TaxID=3050071 RepID=UPI00255B728D|nr:hypothetical protein [Salinicola sp. JS01]WIX34120.1 hypothetical protein QO259_05515 [Salinicola sp. JS01]
MNQLAHVLPPREAPPRCLIVGLMPPQLLAASLTGNLLSRTQYPLTVERDSEVLARGTIEDTGAGLSVQLSNREGAAVLTLHNALPADATWALGKLVQRYTD